MKADKITDILNEFEKLPYKSILFNGPWGIGKTYAADQARTEKIRVSLAGLGSASQIKMSILDSLTSDKKGL